MGDKKNDTIETIGQQATKILGTDINPVSLEDRVNITPINDVEWSGLRGQSFCKPTSIKMKRMLKKYDVEGISYSLNGEPDFDKVAIAKVKISDMTKDLQHDRTSTMKKLLKTDWAKNKKINSVSELEIYIKKHNLTIHESPDGVTEYLIEEEIHKFFKHSGGRHKYRKFENPDTNRFVQTKISQSVVATKKVVVKVEEKIGDAKDFVSEQTGRFMSDDFKQINVAGVDEAFNSAMFAAVLSTTKNTISVVKGEEGAHEAIKEILYDTSSAAVLGYVTGAVKETFDISANGDAAFLVNGTIQISKQVFSYMSGEINEQQLMEGVAETTAYLVAAHIGRNIGGLVGETIIPIPVVGAYIGQCIGEMITTALCAEVISTIKFSKEFDKQNSKLISLYKQAEAEIRASQTRLECLIQRENELLSSTFQEAFEKIITGIRNDSYVEIEDGIVTIGEKFGLSKDDFAEGEVTQENLFLDSDDVLVIK